MPYNFTKLTGDVAAALKAGADAAALVADRGSCNLDGVILIIPRIREEKVIEALAKAGVYTRKQRYGYHGTGYMINSGAGQADKRCVACTAIATYLLGTGYQVSQYYQLD